MGFTSKLALTGLLPLRLTPCFFLLLSHVQAVEQNKSPQESIGLQRGQECIRDQVAGIPDRNNRAPWSGTKETGKVPVTSITTQSTFSLSNAVLLTGKVHKSVWRNTDYNKIQTISAWSFASSPLRKLNWIPYPIVSFVPVRHSSVIKLYLM